MNSGAVRTGRSAARALAAHVLDVAADAVVGAIAFAADLLVAAQDRLAGAHIDDDVAVFLALDQTVDDRAGAILEFFVLTIPLGFADLSAGSPAWPIARDPAHFDRRHFLDSCRRLRDRPCIAWPAQR